MRKYIISAVIISCLALAGCGSQNPWETSGRGDAPIDDSKTDDSAAKIINFPDMFANVAFKCNGTVGVYTTGNGGQSQVGRGVAVVPNDPNCPGSTPVK